LPWARLFEPAITLAEQGFSVGARMAGLLRTADARWLKDDAQARAYFFHPGTLEPVAQGERLANPAFAAVLRRFAAQGSAALHEGPAAADIARRVRGHARHAGRLSEADLAAYRPKQREPICTAWRRYRVCGFPPPSSAHLATMQILGLLDHLPAPPAPLEGGLPGAAFLHRDAEVARLAYADRARYVADPDFAGPPAGRWTSLLDEPYLARRAQLFSERRSLGQAAAGDPGDAHSLLPAPVETQPEHGTSHIAIVDRAGHAVSMTTTVEAAFGSRIMSDGGTGLPGGFLLNNELTDFAFVPRVALCRPVATRVERGMRPRSSLGPTLVLAALAPQRLVMVVGSPGGATIIHYNAKVLLATLGWGLSAQEAVDLPNFANDNGATRLETGRFPASTREALAARGQRVVEQDLTSGTQVLLRDPGGGGGGGADPRREGVGLGD
jgi:gamma-glutamyltranspeptidase/glutathione hydrolase